MHWHARPHAPRLDRLVEHLDRALNLTPQQHESVRLIVQRHAERMSQISASVRPQMRQEIDSTNAEIEKVLTPEQRTKFQQLQQQRQQRRNRRGSRGPAGMPPHPPPDAH
jgi:Spy/CpxP family protein refolding chaperone